MLALGRHVLSGALLRFVSYIYIYISYIWTTEFAVITQFIAIKYIISFQGLFPPGQGATIGVDFMIKTVEIKGEKVKVYKDENHVMLNKSMCLDDLSCSFRIYPFSSCRYGTRLDRRDFAPSLRVITVVPTPSFSRMTLPVRTPSGAFQSG